HNLAFYDLPTLTTFSGKHLANRVFYSDGLIDPIDPDTRYIFDRVSESGFTYAFPGLWWQFERALRTDGSTSLEADRRIRSAAIAAIRTDPWRYATNTVSNLFVDVFFEDDYDGGLFWDEARRATVPDGTAPRVGDPFPPLENQARARVLAALQRPA